MPADSLDNLLLERETLRSRVTFTATARSYRVGDSSVSERIANARYDLYASRLHFRVDGSVLRFSAPTATIEGSLPVAARLDVALRPGDTLSAFIRTASRPLDLTVPQTSALSTAGTSTLDLESTAFGTPAVGGGRLALAFPIGGLVLATRAGIEIEPRPRGSLPVYWRGTTLRGGVALTSAVGDGSLGASIEATTSTADSLGGRNLFPGGGTVMLQLISDASVLNPFDPLEDERWPVSAVAFYVRPFSNNRADQPNLIIPQGALVGAMGTLFATAGDYIIAPSIQVLRETSASESGSALQRSRVSGSAWTAQAGLDVTIPLGSAFELTPQAGYTIGNVGASIEQTTVRRGRGVVQSTAFNSAIRGSWLSLQLSATF